ncbi:MAG: S41 family peptidase [Candidatus Omnitrophica bacterium]|nr:S41 family peptidase [Candidatus Omnitrophota bacterium]
MKLRRIFTWVLVVGITMFVTAVAVSEIEKKQRDEIYKQIELFTYAFSVIKSEYVSDPAPKDLIYGALKGMLAGLDSHSQFMDPDTYNELKVETEGKFGGLGIEISIKDSLLTIITPIEDTPAWKVGLKAGDRIVKIGDELTRDFTLTDAVKRLRGKPGTSVTITVLRESEGKLLPFTIERAIINIKDVKEAKILEDNIGYIRLVEFRENTEKAMDKALTELKKQNANCVILDLRNNPGGLLDSAVKVTNFFIEPGKTIVYTKGRKLLQNITFKSSSDKPILDWPMVVLVNEGSASGSEIVAGALQDYKRAIILGAKTFGKGSVQTVIPLADGSALRLTTSEYFIPSGKNINKEGVTPDVKVDQKVVELKDATDTETLFKEILDGKTPAKDEKKADADYKSDYQLVRAIDLLKGIRVFKQQDKK